MIDFPPPRDVLCVGRNYAAHAAELGHAAPKSPLLFWKPAGSLCRGGEVALPRWADGPTRVDYEGELALVLGRDLGPGTPPLPADPWEAVAAVAAALDLSDRDLQKAEPQWVRAKGFAQACVVGDLAAPPRDPAAVTVRTWKNGAKVQDGHTGVLLFPLRDLLRWVHGFLRLSRGDLILTGTPEGVGPLAPGDEVRVEVSYADRAGGDARAEVAMRCAEGPVAPAFAREGGP